MCYVRWLRIWACPESINGFSIEKKGHLNRTWFNISSRIYFYSLDAAAAAVEIWGFSIYKTITEREFNNQFHILQQRRRPRACVTHLNTPYIWWMICLFKKSLLLNCENSDSICFRSRFFLFDLNSINSYQSSFVSLFYFSSFDTGI